MYVKQGAYKDIPKKFINYTFLKEEMEYEGLDILYDIYRSGLITHICYLEITRFITLLRSLKNMDICISINPRAIDNILNGKKTCEFRNYIPKYDFNYIYVYVTAPVKKLKYIFQIKEIIKYGEKELDDQGIGNLEFNEGKKAEYAYILKKVYEIPEIDLKQLKTFGLNPPQKYYYIKDKEFETLQLKKKLLLEY